MFLILTNLAGISLISTLSSIIGPHPLPFTDNMYSTLGRCKIIDRHTIYNHGHAAISRSSKTQIRREWLQNMQYRTRRKAPFTLLHY